MKMTRAKGETTRFELFCTGFLLGQFQIILGFSALLGAGANIGAWFLLLLAWLTGGFCGSLSQRTEHPFVERISAWLAVLGIVGTQVTAQVSPFLWPHMCGVFGAACCSGVWAGAFLSRRARLSMVPGRVFFHENNGFVLGVLFATLLLLFSASALLASAFLLFVFVRLFVGSQSRLSSFVFALGIAAGVFQWCARTGSLPQYDGLMTAAVLTHAGATPLSGWLYFAHPLMLPLTIPFSFLCSDRLGAVVLRETVSLAGLVCLLCSAVLALAREKERPWFGMIVAVLLFVLSVGRFQMATQGEEKDTALLFGMLFLFLYFEHCGYWSVGVWSSLKLSFRARTIVLSALLAFAVLVHLVNGVLLIFVVLDALLSLWPRDMRRERFVSRCSVVLFSGVLLLPTLFALARWTGKAKSVREGFEYFFAYHVSGEFFSFPKHFPEDFVARALDCVQGLRGLWFGETETVGSWFGVVFLLLLCGVASVRLFRLNRLFAGRLFVFLFLHVCHFYFYEPDSAESWIPFAFCVALLLSVGLRSPGWGRFWDSLLRLCLLPVVFLLAFHLGGLHAERRGFAKQVQAFVGAPSPSAFPVSQVVRFVDGILDRDADVFVDDRLLASYFQIYTARNPVVRPYVGFSEEELRRRFHLSALSLHFYSPQKVRGKAILGAVEQSLYRREPAFLVSEETTGVEQQALPFGKLFLSKMEPERTADQGDSGYTNREPNVEALLDNHLELLSAKSINADVYKLTFRRGTQVFSAKWKPMGVGGSEEQNGLDGNNSPRCEVAARKIDRVFSQGKRENELVPEVVLRAFHRNVECNRVCKDIPKILSAEIPATFPKENDHLVLGALTRWVEDAGIPVAFEGEFWEAHRYETEPDYRKQMSALFGFLFLISHGDANFGENFLYSEGPPYRVYSIDNGRSLDGIPYYVGAGEPDWEPMRRISTEEGFVRSFENDTLSRVQEVAKTDWGKPLYVLHAVHLQSGRSVTDVEREPMLSALGGRSLSEREGLKRIGRGSFLLTDARFGGPWLVQGISEQGVLDLVQRARALLTQKGSGTFVHFLSQ